MNKPEKRPSAKLFSAQAGNVLFLILIAVALFAAVSYAVTRSSRGSGDVTKEKAQLNAALAEQCTAGVEHAVLNLKLINKCADDQISYELADGTNENPSNPSDKNCFVFDPLGAGGTPCGPWLTSFCSPAQMLALNPGEKCTGADIVYVGTSGGHRLYTTSADLGTFTFDNGQGNGTYQNPGPTADGMFNTDLLVAATDAGAPYTAAVMCRSLGAKWYLPSINELTVLQAAKSTGVLNGTFNLSGGGFGGGAPGWYWSSSFAPNYVASGVMRFSDGTGHNLNKGETNSVRCVRSD